MAEVYACALCRQAYQSRKVQGVWVLPRFEEYTVDLRLQEFRTVSASDGLSIVPFESTKGRTLLERMHQQMGQ
jgi:hypothetical protein